MTPENPLLIVDDDASIREQLNFALEADYTVVQASSRSEAIAAIRRHQPAVVTLDLGLPPDAAGVSEGFATLQEIINLAPMTKVLVLTGQHDPEIAVRAVGLGAFDFYEKPIDLAMLSLMIRRGFYLHALEKQSRALISTHRLCSDCGIVSSNPAMDTVCRMIEKVAGTTITTLLLGESGTGKELLARALHNLSDRADGPFVAINCAAIPESLLESELFGYEKGAFTGANTQHRGRIECAHGGTLFLDEVGDLPVSLQPKLLRFLQERTVERLGGHDSQSVDVRIVCATHRPLEAWAKAGKFREDLFYRIHEIGITIPPLRERGQDALMLARVLLSKFSKELKRPVKGFVPEAIQALEQYPWPGNVRELENCIKRALIVGEGPWIRAEDLSLPTADVAKPLNLRAVREDAERRAIARAMTHVDGNVSKAAELLGITRPTLYNLMEKLGIRDKQYA